MAGQEVQNFDIEVAIANFLADATSSSLELPHMTTGQRKHARKTAEQHSEIVCESFGFGAERKLLLIKKGSSASDNREQPTDAKPCAVNVKNTFIDDWVAMAQSDESPEPIVFRSMPSQLREDKYESPFIEAGSEPIEADRAAPQMLHERKQPRAASPDCSTTASEAGGEVASWVMPGSPASSHERETMQLEPAFEPPPGLPLPPGLKVRNTFIHVDTPNVDSVPQRVVQSMPHGMFGQMLLNEKKAAATVPIASEASPAVPSQQSVSVLAMGSEVVIEGLSKLPAFNGLTGTVQGFDEESGRYSIAFVTPVNGHKMAKVKRDNLCAVLPSTPFAPMFGSPATLGGPIRAPSAGTGTAPKEKSVLRLTALV